MEKEREVSVSLPLVNDSGEIEAETTFCGELCVFNGRLGRNRTVSLMLFGFWEPDRNLSFSLRIRAKGDSLLASDHYTA